jgi:heme-degrading monooxygenase HmoA
MVLATVYFKTTDPNGFLAALDEVGGLMEGVDGFNGLELRRGIEDPSKFLITADWDSVAAHEAWQESRGPEFLAALGPHTDGGPSIEHFA